MDADRAGKTSRREKERWERETLGPTARGHARSARNRSRRSRGARSSACTARGTSRAWTTSATWASPASTRSRAACTRPCTGAGPGRSGSSWASATRTSPTSGSSTSSSTGAPGLNVAYDMPTIHGLNSRPPAGARRGRPRRRARATRSRTWSGCSPTSRWPKVSTSLVIAHPPIPSMYFAIAQQAGRRLQEAAGHVPERHLLPGRRRQRAGPAAPRRAEALHRRRRVLHAERAALVPDQHRGLPDTGEGLHRRPGARVHPQRGHRFRHLVPRPRAGHRQLRPEAHLHVERAQRLLRGDSQVPRGPAALGAYHEGALRRDATRAR